MSQIPPFFNSSEQSGRLGRVLKNEHNEQTCDRCIEQLSAYIDAQLAGEDYLARFPEVAAHLDACLDCAGAYARLYDLEIAARSGLLPVSDIPAANLTFLDRERPRSAIDLGQMLAQALRSTADGLVFQFSQALLVLLQPGPQPAAALRSTPDARYGDVLYRLTATQAPDREMAFELVVYQDKQDPAHCLIEIQLQPAGQNWPDLPIYDVALQAGNAVRTVQTDAWGLASFEDVPLDHLAEMSVTVRPAAE